MKRKIYQQLLEWKQKDHNKVFLLIDGARRVGKSWIVEEFAKREYDSYVIIDFNEANSTVKEFFTEYLHDLDDFYMRIEAFFRVKLIPGKSLVVFDEVQQFPPARAALKYLIKDGRFDFIETGSLVSIKKNVKDIVIPSEERHIKLLPMDFEEFLWATGNESLMNIIKKCYETRKPMGAALHRKAMDAFRQYMIVGGMPQAVKAYTETQDFDSVDAIKRDILNLYRNDIIKYANSNSNSNYKYYGKALSESSIIISNTAIDDLFDALNGRKVVFQRDYNLEEIEFTDKQPKIEFKLKKADEQNYIIIPNIEIYKVNIEEKIKMQENELKYYEKIGKKTLTSREWDGKMGSYNIPYGGSDMNEKTFCAHRGLSALMPEKKQKPNSAKNIQTCKPM